jgi:YD repeat-containing protein
MGQIYTTNYDQLQRPQDVAAPDGGIWTTVYDQVSNPNATVLPLNQRVATVYYNRIRVVNTLDELGRITTTTWDILNQLQTFQDQKGQITTHFWDARNLEVGRQFMNGTRVTNVYNSLRQLTNVTDGAFIYTMSYDILDRLLTTNAPGHPGGMAITYSYDENSNLTISATPWGLFTSTYDARDQISSLRDPGYASMSVKPGIATFTHDARMLLTKQVYANGVSATIAYDANKRAIEVLYNPVATGESVIDHCWVLYDSADRPLTRSTVAGTATFGYDSCDRLLSQYDPLAGLFTYGYDLAGRRVNMQSPAGRFTYSYDIADEMLSQITPIGSMK